MFINVGPLDHDLTVDNWTFIDFLFMDIHRRCIVYICMYILIYGVELIAALDKCNL